MRKSPERCIYCGRVAKMTREHIFGTWLKNYLKVKSVRTDHFTTLVETKGGIPIPSMSKGRLNRPGDPHSQQLKLVCKQCNETWMGVIQNDAKPFLIEMLHGRWPSLDSLASKAVATWACMVTTSIEFADEKTNTSAPEERQAFKAELEPSRYWLIYVGLCDSGLDPGSFWHRGGMWSVEDIADGIPKPFKVQTTTFYLGRCFFHTVRAPSDYLPDPVGYGVEIGIRQLWPTAAVPPAAPLVFTKAGVRNVALAYWRRFNLPLVDTVTTPIWK